jgi:hypothetical protein
LTSSFQPIIWRSTLTLCPMLNDTDEGYHALPLPKAGSRIRSIRRRNIRARRGDWLRRILRVRRAEAQPSLPTSLSATEIVA